MSIFLAPAQTALLLVRSLPVYALQRALFQSQVGVSLALGFRCEGHKYRKRDRQDSNSCMDFLNGFLSLGSKSSPRVHLLFAFGTVQFQTRPEVLRAQQCRPSKPNVSSIQRCLQAQTTATGAPNSPNPKRSNSNRLNTFPRR